MEKVSKGKALQSYKAEASVSRLHFLFTLLSFQEDSSYRIRIPPINAQTWTHLNSENL